MSLSSSGSWARSFSIWRTAWITVVWSRPPKRRPISGSDRGARCLERAVAGPLGRGGWVDPGGVVAPAGAAGDLRQRPRGELLGKVHGDLARTGDFARAAGG